MLKHFIPLNILSFKNNVPTNKFTVSKNVNDAESSDLKNEKNNSFKNNNTTNAGQSYLTYYNERYGFSTKYPANFIPGPLPTNGDGRSFYSPDGLEEITVFGSNYTFQTIDDAVKFEIENIGVDLSYKYIHDNWFVISYIKDGYIYYVKEYVGKGSTNTLLIRYPISLKEKYSRLIPILVSSFKPGNLDIFH